MSFIEMQDTKRKVTLFGKKNVVSHHSRNRDIKADCSK